MADDLSAGPQTQTEDAGVEEPEPKRPLLFPASMGLSVFLPPARPSVADTIDVEVRYADYDVIDVALEHKDKTVKGYKRVPHAPVSIAVPLDDRALKTGVLVPESRGLVLKGELRTTSMEGLEPGTRVLSLFLVNNRTALEKDGDANFAFQVKLALSFKAGFVPRPNRRGEASSDGDSSTLALLFRDHYEWAVGHNTSVVEPQVVNGRVARLETTQLPCYEVRPVKHAGFEGVTLEMAILGKLDGAGLENALSPLIDEYARWIEKQRVTDVRHTLRDTQQKLAAKAERAKKRMLEGLTLLRDDAELRQAFHFANQAMHVAAVQADQGREDRRYKDGKLPKWRPFQLAFLLLNIPSISDPDHVDRTTADLIYFPTGGGKTEAYLGLIALTLCLRRLRGGSEDHEGRGVAVVLRYTLRLLTLDQLGRAATLMCALEELRRRNPKELGSSRFTVGLWVGSSATPNRLKDVHKALHEQTPGLRESPFPLSTCPWCNSPIKQENIKLVDLEGTPTKKNFARAVVYCEKAECLYTERKQAGLGLPVLFVDEQIYQELPSFLVATVDKFAMMPWRREAGMLFGRVTQLDARRAYGGGESAKGATKLRAGLWPPELIVQDELHLISGPLGTMVGLYEAAIDYLCGRNIDGKARPPKVVCSTATVRRAREQIRALFGRDLALFPPQGIDQGDNFFAQVDANERGRLYVGVAAPGRALRTVSVRTYATVLAAAQRHFDPKGKPEQPADPYMTLVGYFNSLRELGGMRRLVEDEVRNRVRHFESGSDRDPQNAKRPLKFVGPHPWAADRTVKLPEELTSRESTERVKLTKARLAARRTAESPEPLDVVLASNMISVGLDIDRLGLMVVTGQPKTSSEYIQATSRVGRSYPGLVVTCLNVSRPRDRSHFERFVAYHQSFYRDVEATSVTPFSGQTLDRGLVGTLLSMIRHGVDGMAPPTGAMLLREKRENAEQIVEWLVKRACDHRGWQDETAENRVADLVRARGRNFLDAWQRVIDKARAGAAERIYSRNDGGTSEGKPLLFTAIDDPPTDQDEQRFEVSTSMRDVEASTDVWLRFKPLDAKD
jgi:hypothetical protein